MLCAGLDWLGAYTSTNSASSSGSALPDETVVAVVTSLRSVRLPFGFRRFGLGFSSERATMALDRHSRNIA